MVYPRNLGDKQLFREDFYSTATLNDNGGVLSSATVSAGVMTCSSGGADYLLPNLDAFWELGGTIRLVIQSDTVSGSKRFFNYTAGSTNRSIVFLRTLSTGSNFLQIRDGAGNNFYWVNIISGQSTSDVEFVMTWDPASTTITAYVDGASATADSSAGTQAITPDSVQQTLRLGTSVTGPWIGTYKRCEVYVGAVWTQEEVTDAFEEDTYAEVDHGKALIYAPMVSQFNDGTQKTINKGTSGVDITMGDGSTAGTFPTVITTPFNGFSTDTTDDWVDFGDDDSYSFSDGATDSPFSLSILAQPGDRTDFNLISKGTGLPGAEYALFGGSNNQLQFVLINADVSALLGRNTANDAICTGCMMHIVCTYDGSGTESGMRVYINGARADTVSNSSGAWDTMTPGSGVLRIGNIDLGGGASFSPIKMHEFALWDFTLTPRQVRWLSEKAFKELNI